MTADLQRHPLSAAFGDMPADEFAELVADIKRNGLVQTIVTIRDEHGTEFVLDGWHRYRACIEAGVKPRTEPFDYVVEPADEQAGKKMTPAEFVVAANAHRRHLTREQRRQIVGGLLKAKPEASDRVIATQAKVSDKTVGAVRRELVAGAEIPHQSERVGKDGKKQAKSATKPRATPPPGPRGPGARNVVVVDGVEVLDPTAARPPRPAAQPARPALPTWPRFRPTARQRFHKELGDAAGELRRVARIVGANALHRKQFEHARKTLVSALELLDKLAQEVEA